MSLPDVIVRPLTAAEKSVKTSSRGLFCNTCGDRKQYAAKTETGKRFYFWCPTCDVPRFKP